MADEQLQVSDDRQAIALRGLRLAFRWTGDRWTHALDAEQQAPGAWTPLARALEGDPDRDDPARVVSPAYQQLHWQAIEGGGTLAMLVGQSGPHHFSAVFTIRAAEDDSGGVIAVDVADRCRGAIRALAATYQVFGGSGALVEADPGRVVWEVGSATLRGRLGFAPKPPARACLAEAGRQATPVQALADLLAAEGHTYRWAYEWRWTVPA